VGEILRAIMDRNSIYSQTTFFSIPLTIVTTVAAKSFARRQASALWKTDAWFLVIGWAQFAAYDNAVNRRWAPPLEATTFQLLKGNNQEPFELAGPSQKATHNGNLNNFLSLSEYPLIAPGELVTIQQDVEVTEPVAPFTNVTTVTLQGVEYNMPPGKGGGSF
jgi:hypothetical protein